MDGTAVVEMVVDEPTCVRHRGSWRWLGVGAGAMAAASLSLWTVAAVTHAPPSPIVLHVAGDTDQALSAGPGGATVAAVAAAPVAPAQVAAAPGHPIANVSRAAGPSTPAGSAAPAAVAPRSALETRARPSEVGTLSVITILPGGSPSSAPDCHALGGARYQIQLQNSQGAVLAVAAIAAATAKGRCDAVTAGPGV